MNTDWLRFGVLGRPHGVSGEIVLAPYNLGGRSLCDEPLPIKVTLSGAAETVKRELVGCRPVSAGYLVRLDGCSTREQAALLVGLELHVARAMLGPLPDGEFYVEDLVGCEAFSPSGARLGEIAGTFWNGVHDIMTIRGEDGDEQLYPVVAEFVRAFDRDQRRVIVDPHD